MLFLFHIKALLWLEVFFDIFWQFFDKISCGEIAYWDCEIPCTFFNTEEEPDSLWYKGQWMPESPLQVLHKPMLIRSKFNCRGQNGVCLTHLRRSSLTCLNNSQNSPGSGGIMPLIPKQGIQKYKTTPHPFPIWRIQIGFHWICSHLRQQLRS